MLQTTTESAPEPPMLDSDMPRVKFPLMQTMGAPFCGKDGQIKPRKMPVKLEPKTFFANERTLLKWINSAVMLGGMWV
jgi:hypothetical protein